jgi:hypothetical protein
MIVAVADLPSKGFRCDVAKININAINYKQLTKYNKQLSNTYLQKLYRDMDVLKEDIGEDFDKLAFYDLDMLMFYKKLISVTDDKALTMKLNYRCLFCGQDENLEINVNSLSYPDFDELLTRIEYVELGGKKYKVKFPTMGDAKKVADTLLKYREDIDDKLFLQLCLFDFDHSPNIVKSMVEGATGSDILMLEYLYGIYNGANKEVSTTCTKCGKENVIRTNTLMTDFLRLLRLNCRVDASKIILSKAV